MPIGMGLARDVLQSSEAGLYRDPEGLIPNSAAATRVEPGLGKSILAIRTALFPGGPGISFAQ